MSEKELQRLYDLLEKVKDEDEDMATACEEDERNAENLAGQMEITDFPEVMP